MMCWLKHPNFENQVVQVFHANRQFNFPLTFKAWSELTAPSWFIRYPPLGFLPAFSRGYIGSHDLDLFLPDGSPVTVTFVSSFVTVLS